MHPDAHEAIAPRILVGEAGRDRHKNDPAIAAYRKLWLDALLAGTRSKR